MRRESPFRHYQLVRRRRMTLNRLINEARNRGPLYFGAAVVGRIIRKLYGSYKLYQEAERFRKSYKPMYDDYNQRMRSVVKSGKRIYAQLGGNPDDLYKVPKRLRLTKLADLGKPHKITRGNFATRGPFKNSQVRPRVQMPRARYYKKTRKTVRRRAGYGGRGSSNFLLKRKLDKLSKQVRYLRRSKYLSKTMDYRAMDTTQITSAVNSRGCTQIEPLKMADISGIVDTTCPVVDGNVLRYNDVLKADGGHLQTVGGGLKVIFANNYNYDCYVYCLWLWCDDFTSNSGNATATQLLDRLTIDTAQAQITNGEEFFFWSYDDINSWKGAKWQPKKKARFMLKPGERRTLFFPFLKKRIVSDLLRQHSGVSYCKNLSHSLQICTGGQVAHGAEADTQSSNVGISDSKLDIVYTTYWKYRASNMLSVKTLEGTQSLGAMTNPNVVQEDIEEKTDVIG